jgi:hypothetical protein
MKRHANKSTAYHWVPLLEPWEWCLNACVPLSNVEISTHGDSKQRGDYESRISSWDWCPYERGPESCLPVHPVRTQQESTQMIQDTALTRHGMSLGIDGGLPASRTAGDGFWLFLSPQSIVSLQQPKKSKAGCSFDFVSFCKNRKSLMRNRGDCVDLYAYLCYALFSI